MEKLLSILKEIRPDVDFANEQDLIGSGILDSLDIMEIVAEIGDAFGSLFPLRTSFPQTFIRRRRFGR